MKGDSDRGIYRANYESLADDADFQELSPIAQAVYHTLKLKLGLYGISVFYPSVLCEYHRRSTLSDLLGALDELARVKPSGGAGWIRFERNVFWIRNGLRYEPAISLDNANHRTGATRHALSLPRSAVVVEFARHYALDVHLDMPSASHPEPIAIRETETKTDPERDRDTTSSTTARAREGRQVGCKEPDIAATLPSDMGRAALSAITAAAPNPPAWLAEMAACLNGMAGHPTLTGTQLGTALREYVGNGEILERMSFARFRGYLRNAAKPPPAEHANGNGARRGRRSTPQTPPQHFEYPNPTESAEDVKWRK